MTDQQLQDLVASLVVENKITSRVIKELGKQIGGMHNKFGSYTEGLSAASIGRILRQRFGCEFTIGPVRRYRKEGGEKTEVDFMGYTNGGVNKVVAVEVKSHLRPENFAQLEQLIENFPRLFPQFHGYTLEAMFAVVSSEPGLEEEALRRGFHLAKGSHEVFALVDPPDFVPRRIQI